MKGVREEKWTLPMDDGHLIYGVTNYAREDGPSDKCIVIVHDLSGDRDLYRYKRAAQFFPARGYDVVRFNLYSWEEKARRLFYCTLQTHADDVRTVLKEKASDYKKKFLIGHSYGGPSIMVAQPRQATALSLWDPSFDLPRIWDADFLRQKNGVTYFDWGVWLIVSQEMVSESRLYDEKSCLALSESLNVPIQVISAGAKDQFFIHDKHSYHSAGHPLNERKVVDGADHCFNNGDTCDTLLDYTAEWFERF